MPKSWLDPRREARMFRRMGLTAVEEAWNWGQDAAYRGRPYRNPYPPGRRHDEYKRGFHLADPMGDHHGRNL